MTPTHRRSAMANDRRPDPDAIRSGRPAQIPEIGLQLYTVRDRFEADPDDTLARIERTGIRLVEPYTFVGRAGELRDSLDRHGLKAPIAHANLLSDTVEYAGHTVTLPPAEYVFAEAEQLGISTIIDPVVPPDRWQHVRDIEATAARLNECARRAAEFGITLGYHNHSFEFHHRVGEITAYEYFVRLLDANIVVELDIFWAAVAGEDVAGLASRLGDRLLAMHLKDGSIEVDPFSAGTDGYVEGALDQVRLGEGELDVVAAMSSARTLRYAVIEFDYYDGDVFDAIDDSAKYLRSIGAH